MAKVSNTGTRIWLDQYDLSPFLSAADQEVKQEVPVVTCFSDAGPRRLSGNYDVSLSYSGFFDAVDDSYDEIMFALVNNASDHYVSHLLGSSAAGGIAYELTGRLEGQPRSAAVGGAVALNFNLQGSSSMGRGHILRNATITADGNGTGYNTGITAGTYAVVIRCFSATVTGFTVKVQQSSDDGAGDAYADIAGISQAITAAGVWRLTTVAATEAWKRVVISGWNGTTAVIGVTAAVMV